MLRSSCIRLFSTAGKKQIAVLYPFVTICNVGFLDVVFMMEVKFTSLYLLWKVLAVVEGLTSALLPI